MPLITYVEHDGTRHPVEVDEEMNLMEGATLNMIPGVEGICGGICSCATCHCYVDDAWADKIPAKEAGEQEMLDGANPEYIKPQSRLGCQVVVTADMDGMEVLLPAEQG